MRLLISSATLLLIGVASVTTPAQAQQLSWQKRGVVPKQPVVTSRAPERAIGTKQHTPAPLFAQQPKQTQQLKQAQRPAPITPPAAKSLVQATANARPRMGSAVNIPTHDGNDIQFMSSQEAAKRAQKVGQSNILQTSCNCESGMCGDGGSCPCDGPCDGSCGCEIGCGVPDCGCCDACGVEGGCGCGDCCEPSCGTCPPSLGGCARRGCIPLIIYVPPLKNISLGLGVQGFKGPLDRGRDRGNFGFHEAVNLGGHFAWLPWPNMGYQIGYRATQSQLSGDDATNNSDSLSQDFLTAGLFHRSCAGLQFGVVWDYLDDERQGDAQFNQIRGEIGILNPRGHEIGFAFASHTDDNRLNSRVYQGDDQYLLFYQFRGCNGGEGRLYAGFDDDSRGILGARTSVPISQCWAMQGGFTYFIPDTSVRGSGAEEEGWNLSMSLVWHFGGGKWFNNPYRPMFDVADNGSFFVDDRP